MDAVTEYLVSEKSLSPANAEKQKAKIAQHPDLNKEFEDWIARREYEAENSIEIEGYTAKDIFELAPYLDGIGVFNFMVSLRERPESAKKIIADGFKFK